MTWLSEAHKYIASGVLGGVLGSWVTYGLTFPRERRRTRDAYRGPQRRAIGEILTATHALMLRELEMRTAMTEMVQQVRQLRQQEDLDVPAEQLVAAVKAMGEQLQAAMASLGSALLDVDRAFSIGTLTIVDPPCWEAMGGAYIEFDQIRSAMQAGAATEMRTVEEIEQYTRTVADHATQFNKGVGALVRAAQYRVSPAETFVNPGGGTAHAAALQCATNDCLRWAHRRRHRPPTYPHSRTADALHAAPLPHASLKNRPPCTA